MAETSFGNIGKTNDEESNMDISLVSQKQHKLSPSGRSSQNKDQYRDNGAVGSLYVGNPRADHFTSQYSLDFPCLLSDVIDFHTHKHSAVW